MDQASQNRLKWKCRRGLLELDLVLQDFVVNRMEEREMDALSDLLGMEDNDLWDIVSGRSDRFDARHGGIVARIRAA
ncbi:MAG TPA: succinate dehydrogenase assembly factor 2 [Burkholderiales bacterium]|jgi:succinate dehydrogenase flavin-adding protein (antitoxin of CptAB toxin-antitoxin module)